MIEIEDLSKEDQLEIEKFSHLCRLVAQAEQAGVPKDEAARNIYPDVYGKPWPEEDETK